MTTTPLRFCTIVARNYWAHVRVLASTLEEQHPGAELTVLLVDADHHALQAAKREAFRTVGPDSIGVERDEFERMAAMYDVIELSTSLKPWLLRTLLREADGPVVYLDPDVEVFASLDEAGDFAMEHGMTLTPHTLTPLPSDLREPSELTILGSGVYNLGFIGVGPKGIDFLNWWAQRLRRDGLVAKDLGMFVDQRWVDLAPTYFEHHVLRDPGWNVAYWNLPSRKLTGADDRYFVDGAPLRFFHYSGFDPERPDRLSRFQGDDPRIALEEHPIVARLCARHAQRLLRAGHRAYIRVPYRYNVTPTGFPLEGEARIQYRHAVTKAETRGEVEPPNPFNADEAEEFPHWLREELGRETKTDVPAVNVMGYVRAESGVGQCARALVAALDAANIERSVMGFDRTPSRQEATFATDEDAEHDIDIIVINADQLPVFMAERGESLAGSHKIGVWNWEVDRMPEGMGKAAELVDEIWVASEHAAHAVRAATHVPVKVFPIPVVAPDGATRTRADLGLPDGFMFLFCFDFDSVFERKNPLAVVEAFSQAFAPGEGPQLVIKSVRGDAHPVELAQLRAASGRPDIHLIDTYLTDEYQHGLMASCDAYISLHRAEGFGLTLAEAMAAGKPVIATNYSGNLEFMDDTNSILVDHTLTSVPERCDPYPTDAVWAEPDIAGAARAMRELVADPDRASEIGRRAAEDIALLHAPGPRGQLLALRLREIAPTLPTEPKRKRRGPPPPPDRRDAAHEPLDRVRTKIAIGPNIGSPAAHERISKSIRQLILRALRHYDDHRRQIDEVMIESIEGVREEMRAVEHRAFDDTKDATSALGERFDDLEAELNSALERIRTLERELRHQRRQSRDGATWDGTDLREPPAGG